MSEHENDNSGNSDESAERRSATDSQARDRRVIPRVAEADLRNSLKSSMLLCRSAVVLSAVYILILIIKNIWGSNLELNRSIFFSVVVAILAFGLHQLGQALRSYLQNESKARLVVVSERLFQALFLLLCTGVILGIVHIITLF